MAFLYGRAGRLTAKNGIFRRGQWAGWRLVCGACWREASGGVPDGDAAHPEYQYGGLWRFRKTDLTEPPERLLSACQLADVDAT